MENTCIRRFTKEIGSYHPKQEAEFNADFKGIFKGFPEYFADIAKQFAIYGRINIYSERNREESLSTKINKAIKYAEFISKTKSLLSNFRGEVDPALFTFKHGGTTVTVNTRKRTVLIEQTATAAPNEIKELQPLIEEYKKMLKEGHEYYLGKNRKRRTSKKEYRSFSFIINFLTYQALIDSDKERDRTEIWGYVCNHIKLFLPKNTKPEKLAPLKINKKSRNPDAFFKRLDRLKARMKKQNEEESGDLVNLQVKKFLQENNK